ncbi:MAG: hypothetical protein MJZ34_02685 [Paludibacteraceae bacterium]|nr:hypothetical protein [Paludibacteraceae bacterium]
MKTWITLAVLLSSLVAALYLWTGSFEEHCRKECLPYYADGTTDLAQCIGWCLDSY